MNHKAIRSLYPEVVTIYGENAYDETGNLVEIDSDAINSWVDPNAYKQDRQRNYPFIADQLDMLWHAIDSGTLNTTSDFYTAIKAVKDAYPKSE